jgi:hypothetical protein
MRLEAFDSMKSHTSARIAVTIAAALAASCATNPVTGQRQLAPDLRKSGNPDGSGGL